MNLIYHRHAFIHKKEIAATKRSNRKNKSESLASCANGREKHLHEIKEENANLERRIIRGQRFGDELRA
jgi:hypothetical protein